MKNHNKTNGKRMAAILIVTLFALTSLTGCGTAAEQSVSASELSAAATLEAETATEVLETEASEPAEAQEPVSSETDDTAEPQEAVPAQTQESATGTIVTTANVTSNGVIDATELFSDRDLTQTPDLSEAVYYSVADGEDIHITEAGVYVLTGTASNVTVYVEADSEAKIQLVLDGISIANDDFPCIYATSADKLFVTTVSESTLSVTGAFTSDGDTNTDGVIFSRADVVLNGTGMLNINSTDNGVVSKDDLKVTGGTYNIIASSKALEANDSIRVADGVLNLNAGTDGLHAENDEDDTLGYIYICGGELTINAGDDGIHANSVVQIDDGLISITSAEGIEGTYIQINGGTIDIQASDDGINAAQKSSAYYPTIEINDGYVTVVMGAGDTDGIDSNGNLIINGGTVDVTGQSTFDYDGSAQYNGGTIIVNGQQTDTIPNQMMGGMRGGRGW